MTGGYGNYYYFSKVSECKDCRFGAPTHQSKMLWEKTAQKVGVYHVSQPLRTHAEAVE